MIQDKKLVKLPFSVHFERSDDGKFDFRITITENEKQYSMRDCLRLIVAKEMYESLVETEKEGGVQDER